MQALKVVRPTTVQEAIEQLNEGGDSARPLAGGTDVIVIARARVRNIDVLVDIKQIPELMAIEWDPGTGLTIGAATPCYEIYGNADIVANYPAIIDCATLIGGTGIQGRASFGGNLCNSSPSGDTIPPQIVLEAVANIAGPNGERSVPVEDFCTGPGRNVLEQGEFVVSIFFPAPDANGGARFLRFIPRNEMDIAVCNAASALKLDGDIGALGARLDRGRGADSAARRLAPPRRSSGRRSRMRRSRPPLKPPRLPRRRSTTCGARSSSASTSPRC